MILSITKTEIKNLLCNQIFNLFGLRPEEKEIIDKVFNGSLKRTEICFSKSKLKYYKLKGKTFFNPFHSGQYCIFLYFVSNTIFNLGPKKINKLLADKVYCLNKALNGLDLFYEVKMPKIFSLDHPVGSVIGRAKINNYFSFSARCTVGNNKGIYPIIGKKVLMSNGSSIIGNCIIGNNVIFAANSSIVDMDIPNNSVVYGQFPNNVIKKIPPRKFSKIIKGWLS